MFITQKFQRGLLFLTIAVLCFDRNTILFHGRELILSDLFGVGLIAICLCQRLFQGVPRGAEWIALAYVGWAFLSASASQDPRSSLGGCLTITYLCLLWMAVRETVKEPKDESVFVDGWRCLATLISLSVLLGLFGMALGYSTSFENPFLHSATTVPAWLGPRMHGWFVSPNRMSDTSLLCLGVLIAYRANRKDDWLIGVLCLLTIFTFSAGLGAIAILMAIRSRSRLAIFVASVFAGLLLIINLLSYPHLREGQVYPSQRGRAMVLAAEHFLNHPMLGAGPNQADVRVDFLYPDGQPSYISDPHNLILSLLSQIGVPGLAFFALLVWFSCRKAPPRERYLVLALYLALGYHGIVGSFEDNRHLFILTGFLSRNRATPVLNESNFVPTLRDECGFTKRVCPK